MKTLTITDAKKNLSRWLAAAAQGDDIGIVCGADIIALRKVESTDYARREYAATLEQVAAALQRASGANRLPFPICPRDYPIPDSCFKRSYFQSRQQPSLRSPKIVES